jgi:hypothetical protein
MDNHGTLPERHSAPGPGILLVAANRWSLAARLASGFLDLGCRVAAVCPVPGHPIRKVPGVLHIYRYAARHPLDSLQTAIEEFAPDIIVPVCDRSVQHLHELHARCGSDTVLDRQTRMLIEQSLGPPDSYPIVSSRYDLLMLAKDAGIRVPETVRVDSAEDLRQWESRLPWLLKADGSSSGHGVRRAETLTRGEKALREIASRISAFQMFMQLLLYRDRAFTISRWAGSRPGIIAQAIVSGRPANCAVVCWKGELLAGIAVEVVQADGPFEPAIVVQVVEGREMLDAAKLISRRLQLTGFFGLDFMLEEGTGKSYLIEMNPRCAPPCSLNLGEGRDLMAAFWAKLADQETPQRPSITQKTRIAYFPTAVLRKGVLPDVSQSESIYLDVPVGEPELIQELLHPWSEMSLTGRLFHQLRRNLPLKNQLRKISSRYRSEQNLAGADRWDIGKKPTNVAGICTQNDWR